MQKTCANSWCRAAFEVTDEDLAFYDSVSPVIAGKKYTIPPPTLCPDCRAQRRYSFRNERKLYRRACAKTGVPALSIYHLDSPHAIYSADAWWSDDWDPKEHGLEIDWSRPFFKQFMELYRAVPHIALVNVKNENSEFANQSGWSKDCYMVFMTDFSEDCYYTFLCGNCKNCVDCLGLYDCELCFESTSCTNCYRTFFCKNCSTTVESYFCSDCRGCKWCFGCTGLRNKEYHLFNRQVSKAEWDTWMKEHALSGSEIVLSSERARMEELAHPHPASIFTSCEHCTGNYLTHSKNCIACFDGKDIEDAKYLGNVPVKTKDTHDMEGGAGELMYECVSVGPGYLNRFCLHCWNNPSDLLYCISCKNGAAHLFGCVGLRAKQYCILNKQYSKEEYDELVPKLIDHMRANGEWGEFFPIERSCYAYNESVAPDYFPLSKEEVLKRGWQWREERDEMPKVDRVIPGRELPASIENVPDDIVNWAIECETTKQPFKIIKQELDLYRKMQLPVPRLHPDERQRRRMLLRNPRKLWERKCDHCGKAIQTTYAPDRPEKVYCEECYLTAVY